MPVAQLEDPVVYVVRRILCTTWAARSQRLSTLLGTSHWRPKVKQSVLSPRRRVGMHKARGLINYWREPLDDVRFAARDSIACAMLQLGGENHMWLLPNQHQPNCARSVPEHGSAAAVAIKFKPAWWQSVTISFIWWRDFLRPACSIKTLVSSVVSRIRKCLYEPSVNWLHQIRPVPQVPMCVVPKTHFQMEFAIP